MDPRTILGNIRDEIRRRLIIEELPDLVAPVSSPIRELRRRQAFSMFKKGMTVRGFAFRIAPLEWCARKVMHESLHLAHGESMRPLDSRVACRRRLVTLPDPPNRHWPTTL